MTIRKSLCGLLIGLGVPYLVSAEVIVDEGIGTAMALRATYTSATRYDQTTFLTAHNAFSIWRTGWEYHQQTLDFDQQFFYGVWSFMLDLHWCFDNTRSPYLALAHLPQSSPNSYDYSAPHNHYHIRSCITSRAQRGLYNHQPFESFLKENLQLWLNYDSEAIITLHLVSYTGSNGVRTLHNLFVKTGIFPYLYYKRSNQPWPTLGELRAQNKRLEVFSDNYYDTLRGDIFHNSAYRETEYNLRYYPKCERRFDNRNYDNTTTLMVLNHFYMLSYGTLTYSYHQINNPYAQSIRTKYHQDGPDLATRTLICVTQEGIYPTFIAADFIEEGDFGGASEWVLALNQKRQNVTLPPLSSLSRSFSSRKEALESYWLHNLLPQLF